MNAAGQKFFSCRVCHVVACTSCKLSIIFILPNFLPRLLQLSELVLIRLDNLPKPHAFTNLPLQSAGPIGYASEIDKLIALNKKVGDKTISQDDLS